MKERKRQPEIDFVPEENRWMPDKSLEIWEKEEEELEQTMVLEPLQGRIRDEEEYVDRGLEEEESVKSAYYKYGRDPYAHLKQKPEEAERWPEELEEWPEESERWSEELEEWPEESERWSEEPEEWPEEAERWPEEAEEWTEELETRRKVPKRRPGKRKGQWERAENQRYKPKAFWSRPILFRVVSLICMGILLIGLCGELWKERAVLGPVASVLEEHNYAEILYLFLAVCTAAYGALAFLWIFSGKHVYCDGRLQRRDVGRGMTSFLLFALLAFISARMALRVPEEPGFLRGLSQYLLVTASNQNLIYICSGLGFFSCVLRRFLR
ncbi:MAG: hypothetical protein HFI63_10240 [Lachnospiraceae bacterium]|nr:hypothetical protein [Lachnospiraceae bacterium]